jgi:Polyketide cyclase / dehydrase and lipid transport
MFLRTQGSIVDTSRKIHATKVIDAPAEAVFAVLADPNRHAELDGAGMVQGPNDTTPPIGGIGQVFTMNMHQDDLGDYRMVNTVTAYVPGARIGWGPVLDPTCDAAEKFRGVAVGGHTFTYDLHENDGRTEVTETYDWTSVKDPTFEKLFPLVSEEQLQSTLEHLAAAVR